MAASFVINMLGLGMPLVILQIYDRIIPNLSYSTLFYLLGGLFIVMVIDTLLKVVRSHISGWSSSYIDYVSGVEAIRRVLQATPDEVEKEAASTHIDRMNALSITARMFAGPARMGIVDLPFIFIFLGVMAIVSPTIALLLLGLFSVFAWRLLVRAREIQDLQDERQQLDRRKYDFVIEALSGIEAIKTMSCEPQMMRRYERLQESIAVAFHHSVKIDGATQSLSAAFASVTMVTIVSSGALLVIEGSQSIGSLACCLLLGGRAVEVLVRSVRSWSELSNFDLVKENVDALLSINSDPDRVVEKTELASGEIVLDKVVMTFRNRENDRSYVMSQHIPNGSIIGIKGNLARDDHFLLRLLRAKALPDGGTIRFGGKPVKDLVQSDLTGSIAYVPNSPAIFSGTILENLTLFDPREGLQNARYAAQLIGLESDIQLLPQGYDMPLGTAGNETLPPSFRQRICIARAIAQKPRILILEEANALLDQRADNLLKKGLEQLRGEMTIIFLSNRPSFLAIADRQLVLKDGALQIHEPPAQQKPATDEKSDAMEPKRASAMEKSA
ncbi:ABC transporter transmembrane domain-containing protein [uncultured Cohaesibacter sp.]|uniref:ABC transporter transmembrane domain-containing protein n=1 Tax=uncultured Cohaesibacter sp. TaxID=1002546 RepID=UPI00292FFB45|nr:ABC transporter transmembrane domain-containing protein [uncultured Cohaesibacter sp.]